MELPPIGYTLPRIKLSAASDCHHEILWRWFCRRSQAGVTIIGSIAQSNSAVLVR
jgi:hypothetical protein